MKKHQKVAVIVWTIDPEGNRRFLLRHNKPFDGYDDEWTVVFGNMEDGEDLESAAVREVAEEFGFEKVEKVGNIKYIAEYVGKYGPTQVHFLAIKVEDIDTKVTLNEESIGYDRVDKEEGRQCAGELAGVAGVKRGALIYL